MNFTQLFHDLIGLPDNLIPLTLSMNRPMSGKILFNKELFEDKVNELIKDEVVNKFSVDWRNNRLSLFLGNERNKSWKGHIGTLLFGYDLFNNYNFQQMSIDVCFYRKYCTGNNHFHDLTLSYRENDKYSISDYEIIKLAETTAKLILNTSTGFLSKDNKEEK